MLNDLRIRLRALFRREKVETELDEELRFHLDHETEKYMRRGMSREEAARQARIELGGVEQTKEDAREARGVNFIETTIRDVRYGLRQLRRSPGFTIIAILTLALGIGATTTVASWIAATLLNPIPGVTNTGNLVSLTRGMVSEHPTPPLSYPDYVDLEKGARSLSGLLVYHDDFVTLTGNGRPERLYVEFVSANYFSMLGVSPLLGSVFQPAEGESPGRTPEAVISYALWQSRFGGDRSVIGKAVRINGALATIIGVAPAGFQGTSTGLRTNLWVPLVYVGNRWRERGDFWLNALGRLKPGFDLGQAQAELNLLMQQIVRQYPDSHRGANQITLDPLWRSPFGVNVYVYRPLQLLLGLAVVLLFLACANVANLFLVRLLARRREFALRLSMGASRWQLVRQSLVESLLVALAGGAVAMLLTEWTAGALMDFFPPTLLPITLGGQEGRGVLLAALLISILATGVFGVLPALRASRLAPATVLKEEETRTAGGTGRSRLSRTFVVTQVVFSLLLLISAALLARSFQNEQKSDPGFNPNHVLIASYDLNAADYSQAQGLHFDRVLQAKLKDLPGVQSAALSDFSPLNFTVHTSSVLPEGYVPKPHESMQIDSAIVGPGYFRTLRTPLLAGHGFTAQDNDKSQPVAIVNQQFCKRYWPGREPIGRSVSLNGRTYTVVGIARNAKYRLLRYPYVPAIFLPLYQDYRGQVTIQLRVAGDPRAYASMVAGTVDQMDPNLPLFDVTTLKGSMQVGSVFERLEAMMAGLFGLLALALAAVGIYGVVAMTTRQRTHEIGIRVALGAQKGDVLRLVIGQGLKLTLIGVGIGIGGALALTHLMSSLLYGVKPTDPLTFVAVSLILIGVALLACYIPARKAMRVDPAVALRHE